jgi:hypothetical protein
MGQKSGTGLARAGPQLDARALAQALGRTNPSIAAVNRRLALMFYRRPRANRRAGGMTAPNPDRFLGVRVLGALAIAAMLTALAGCKSTELVGDLRRPQAAATERPAPGPILGTGY